MTALTCKAVRFFLLINRRQIRHSHRHGLFSRMNVESSCSGYVGMSKNTGNGRYINTVFNRTGCKSMADRMKLQLFQVEFLQDSAKMMVEIIGIQHVSVAAEKDEIILLRRMKL